MFKQLNNSVILKLGCIVLAVVMPINKIVTRFVKYLWFYSSFGTDNLFEVSLKPFIHVLLKANIQLEFQS